MPIMLASIDGDPGANFPQRLKKTRAAAPTAAELQGYREAVLQLFAVFDAHRLKGKVTWFVNERDVRWSIHYADLLKDMVARGDTLALHVHLQGLFGSPPLTTTEAVLKAGREALERLESAAGHRCVGYRSGCYFQAAYVYEALKTLGVEVLSDVFPGFKGETKEGFLDNSLVPLNAKPWRHDPDNWLNFESRKGCFWHIPVSGCGVGDLSALAAKARTNRIEVICWDIHPHEIQNPDGSVCSESVHRLTSALETIDKALKPTYMNMDEYRRRVRSPSC